MEKEGLWFNIGADNTDFSKTAKDTNTKLSQMSQNVKAFSKGITASFAEAAKSMLGFYSVAKAGTLFQDLITKNDEFSKSMKEVGTLSADVAKNLDTYKKQILEMSTQIPIAANDAAKALYQINSAGHTGADGMKVLEVSAKAAIGGVTETVTAADTITTVLNAYKMSADEAAKVSDMLFTAVKLGKTSMSELGASIAQVAPIAASFGVGIDEVLAAVASLTKSGTPTAQAMTQIRAALVAMSDKMGVGVFQTLSLQDAMLKMRESFADDKLKDAVGTIEAYNGILGMTGANAKTAADDLQAFADSAGAANDAYSQIDTGKGVELVKLQNNIMKEMQGVTESFNKEVAKVAKSLNEAFATGQVSTYLGVIKELAVAYGVYKATAMAMAAAQSVATEIATKAQDAEMAEIQKMIAFRQAEVNSLGEIVIGESALASERQIAINAARAEAAEVMKSIQAKRAEAAVNLQNAKDQQAYAVSRVAAAKQSIMMRERELAAAVASGDGLRIENAETQLNIAYNEEAAAKRALGVQARKAEIAQIELTKIEKIEEAAATQLDVVAQTEDAVATGFLAQAKLGLVAALNKVKVAMLSNPWTAALVAITALGYAIYKVIGYINDNIEAQEKLIAEAKKVTEAGKDLRKELENTRREGFEKQIESVAKVRAEYESLRQRWNALGDDMSKKKKFLIDNKDAFHQLGFEVNTVTDAETLLVKNTNAVVQALTARAEAMAYQELATEAYKKRITKELEVKNKTKGYARAEAGTKASDLYEDEKKYLSDEKYWYYAGLEGSKLTEEGAKALNKYRNNKVLKKREQGLKSIEKETNGIINDITQSAKKAAQEQEKALKKVGVEQYDGSKTTNKKQDNISVNSEEDKKRREKEVEEAKKRKEKAEQLYHELLKLQQANEDARIELMKEGSAKRIAEINNEYNKEMEALAEQAEKWAKENKEAGIQGKSAASIKGNQYTNLTYEQSEAINKAMMLAQDKRAQHSAKVRSDEAKAEKAAMDEYLSQYGSIEEKRVAITEKYQAMIEEAKTEGEKKTLRKQMESAINAANFDDLKKSIDWDEVFNNLESIATSRLADLKDKMHDALLGGEIRPEDAKVISDRIAAIEAEQNKRRGVFDYSSDTARKNRQQLVSLRTQLEGATTEEQKNAIKQKIANKEKDISEKSLQQRALELSESFAKLAGDVSGVADIFNELGLGDTLVGKIANNAANAVTSGANALSDFASGNYVGAALNAVKAGVSLVKIFDSGNMEAMNESIQDLTETNKALQSSLEDLKDVMEEATVAQASQTYEQQKKLLNQMERNASDIMIAEARKWETGSKSIKGLLGNDKDFLALLTRANRVMGTNVTSATEFLGLGADTLKKLRTQDPELYAAILKAYRDAENKHTGSGVDEMIEDYINQFAGATDELTEALKEKVTGMSFDSLYDNFVSSLMDMNKSAEDFGDDFTQYLMQAVLNAKVGELMKDDLQKFYDEFAVANDDGTLTSTEVNRLRERWDGIVKAGVDLRDGLAEVTGYDASTASSAKTKGFNGMSQEVGNELNGRFAAMQISAGEIMVTTREIAQVIEQISVRRDAYLNDILEAHAMTNSWLESSYRLSRQMLDQFGASLEKIDKNTSNL